MNPSWLFLTVGKIVKQTWLSSFGRVTSLGEQNTGFKPTATCLSDHQGITVAQKRKSVDCRLNFLITRSQ